MLVWGMTTRYKAWVWFGILTIALTLSIIGLGWNHFIALSAMAVLMIAFGVRRLVRFIQAYPRGTEDYEAVS